MEPFFEYICHVYKSNSKSSKRTRLALDTANSSQDLLKLKRHANKSKRLGKLFNLKMIHMPMHKNLYTNNRVFYKPTHIHIEECEKEKICMMNISSLKLVENK